MTEEAADKYVDTFLNAIISDVIKSPEAGKRTLRLLVKEVERDTRHAAYKIVNCAARDVLTMDSK